MVRFRFCRGGPCPFKPDSPDLELEMNLDTLDELGRPSLSFVAQGSVVTCPMFATLSSFFIDGTEQI